MRECGPFRAPDDVLGALPFAFEQHVCFADGVGFRVDLLTVEQAGDLLLTLRADGRQRLLRHSKHAAGPAGAVIQQIGSGLDLGLNRQKDEVRHQSNGVTRRPVLARLFVVLFVELAD